jgi:glycine hydroxymethyltransferase
MQPDHMPELADLIAAGLDPDGRAADVAHRVTAWRSQFSGVHFTAS